ncbi:hypothetical protein J7E73_14495 [Paenibacillus albidus]|uniref:hypothetical protein n=1 Tax=Paenibacillus albidus TaxID=2041023 RepID=UPI001BE9C56E|nr:hypothetical protein [Paenibacillus albidus]MBT2290329.1 hypothetical protein [Paenibacillus albidus]
MLTFEQKLAVLDSYPELERKPVSLGRINYHYEGSRHEKKTVAFHLHPGGNGFVYAGLLRGYETDGKGFVNIRDFSESELRSVVEASMASLSMYIPEAPPAGKRKKKQVTETADSLWTNHEGQNLTLRLEDDLWYVYADLNLEMAFETVEEAREYLAEEGFVPATE